MSIEQIQAIVTQSADAQTVTMKAEMQAQTKLVVQMFDEKIKFLDEKFQFQLKSLDEKFAAQQKSDKEEMNQKIGELFSMISGGGAETDSAMEQDGERPRKRMWGHNGRASSVDATRTDGSMGKNILSEAQTRNEGRVIVDGFLDCAKKEAREKHVIAFLDESNMLGNFPGTKVFARGHTGSEVIIEFKTREKAKQFLIDNAEKIRGFMVPTKKEPRRGFFNLHKTAEEWKIFHATRLLANKFKENETVKGKTMEVKPDKHRGTISVNDIRVVRIKIGTNGEVIYNLINKNIDDLDEVGFKELAQRIIHDFTPTFE